VLVLLLSIVIFLSPLVKLLDEKVGLASEVNRENVMSVLDIALHALLREPLKSEPGDSSHSIKVISARLHLIGADQLIDILAELLVSWFTQSILEQRLLRVAVSLHGLHARLRAGGLLRDLHILLLLGCQGTIVDLLSGTAHGLDIFLCEHFLPTVGYLVVALRPDYCALADVAFAVSPHRRMVC